MILGNTYHLHLRPGEDVIEELGGLHAFSGWDGPILTDSGGFQVFSLRDTLLAVDDDGVTFRSVYDGAAERLTPESVAEIQRRLGSDIAMCLDICPPADATPERARAGRAPHQPLGGAPGGGSARRRGSSASGSRRAAPTRSCGAARSRRSPRFRSTASRWVGWRSARADAEMFDAVGWSTPLLPDDRPRYFMGLGDPEGILEVVARGIDMFDCVLPTRTARTGSALTAMGRLNLRNARFARDPGPLEEGCGCPACAALLTRIRAASRQPAGDPGAAAADPA